MNPKKPSKVFTRGYFVFLVVFFLVAFIAVEVFARAFLVDVPLYIKSENAGLIYELNPAHEEINSFGMRQDEVDAAKLDDYFVIAVIGDSHAYSAEAEDRANTFPNRLENYLGQTSGLPVKVLNLGVPGYNMAQELEVLRAKVPQFPVDLVILQYCINDEHISNFIYPENVWLNDLLYRSELVTSVWKRVLYSNFGKEHIVPYVEQNLPDLLLFERGLVGTRTPNDPDPAHAPHPPRTKDLVPARYYHVVGRENLESNVREFGALAKTRQLPILATGFIEEQDRALYETSGFDVYTFGEMFRGRDMNDFGYSGNTADHFSDSGSDFIGKSLADFIAARLKGK